MQGGRRRERSAARRSGRGRLTEELHKGECSRQLRGAARRCGQPSQLGLASHGASQGGGVALVQPVQRDGHLAQHRHRAVQAAAAVRVFGPHNRILQRGFLVLQVLDQMVKALGWGPDLPQAYLLPVGEGHWVVRTAVLISQDGSGGGGSEGAAVLSRDGLGAVIFYSALAVMSLLARSCPMLLQCGPKNRSL